jgi:hypothetical protein
VFSRYYTQAASKPRKAGQQANLEREPSNKHDRFAIKVVLQPPSGQIGHVPKDTAKWLSPLMDEKQIRATAQVAFDARENNGAKSIVVLVDIWQLGVSDSNIGHLQVMRFTVFTVPFLCLCCAVLIAGAKSLVYIIALLLLYFQGKSRRYIQWKKSFEVMFET